jgi:magnesium-transporting ATPase (P-type)
MVCLGTTAVPGSGLAVATATGLETELGRVGQLVALVGERATPLERQVEGLGRRLMVFAGVRRRQAGGDPPREVAPR